MKVIRKVVLVLFLYPFFSLSSVADNVQCCKLVTGGCIHGSPMPREECQRIGGFANQQCCTEGKFRGQCRGDCSDNGNFVSLSFFKVTSSIKAIHASWVTGSERNNLGMNVWCAQVKDKSFYKPFKLNGKNPVSTLATPPFGANYSISGEVDSGVYYCALEDINEYYGCTLHCDQIASVIVGKDKKINNLSDIMKLCSDFAQSNICIDDLL